jgi:hypothetical protein
MDISLKRMKRVPSELLEDRLERVRELRSDDLESYSIQKDRLSGEHYLHYAYLHMDVAGGGTKEYFHHLLPIDNDDVLGIMFGDQAFDYPAHWRHAYLRNGPEGQYVWFDPQDFGEEEENEAVANEMKKILLSYKEQGKTDPESMRRMFEELEQLGKGKERNGS